MKKFLASICAAALLLTGCGGGGEDKPAAEAPAGAAGDIKLGMISHLNATEQKMGGVLDSFVEKIGLDQKHRPKFYDSFNAMQMGLESGEIEAISTYNSVANYMTANNDKFVIVPNDALNKIKDSFCFAVRKDEAQLKADLDKAIDEMKADGSLDKLVNDYITNVNKGQAPPKVELPMIDGAETIKVGVTGDLPPLDLILPDNSPAGFNTAMLAEVAKRLGKNIEIVRIEAGARAAALQSKLIDVVFWVIVPLGDDLPIDLDKPEGIEISAPYFNDNVAVVKLKDSK